jgi:general L-amino acid transport system substrate-binding protein
MRGKLIAVAVLLMATAFPAAAQSTLEKVKQRGTLLCGVNGQLRGFSWNAQGMWAGLDVDLCRAVAAATLGDARKVEFVPLTAQQRFRELSAGKVDMLARNSTVSLQRLSEGVEPVAINFYDGQAFVVQDKLMIRDVSQLTGSRVCVVRGTTHEANVTNWFRIRRNPVELVTFDTTDAMIDGFLASRCVAATADKTALIAELAERGRNQGYIVLPQIISREPLGPYVRRGDSQWADIVRWSFQAMLKAEVLDLRRDNVQGERRSNDPDVKQLLGITPGNGRALGLDEDWAYEVIHQVGNYGESFERNLGARSAVKVERGQNALWRDGGLMYPLPIR